MSCDLKRWAVQVRCIKPAQGIEPAAVTVDVFSCGDAADACEAATRKMADKYLQHQHLVTESIVTAEPRALP
jgi:hypothetical protein